jgi:hypothetical protein
MRRLDSLTETGTVPVADVWKVDVETFETEVFRGALSLLKSRPPRAVVFEAPWPEGQGEPWCLLRMAGYSVRHLPRENGAVEPFENYFATPIAIRDGREVAV